MPTLPNDFVRLPSIKIFHGIFWCGFLSYFPNFRRNFNVFFNSEDKKSINIIDNIIKYKNKYVGNNSNTGNLISNLPLSEYGYVFEIKDLELKINYHITDWYINENYYLEKSIVYNSISIFALIDNVKYIEFNFSGKSYKVNRDNVVDNFSNFDDIVKDNISKEAANELLCP